VAQGAPLPAGGDRAFLVPNFALPATGSPLACGEARLGRRPPGAWPRQPRRCPKYSPGVRVARGAPAGAPHNPRGCGVCRGQAGPGGGGQGPDSASRGSTAAHADADGTVLVGPIPSPAGRPQILDPGGTVVSRCRSKFSTEG
jgi:hypothetical protein